MDEAKARHLALSEMKKWGLFDGTRPWKFAFNNRRLALGICNPRKRTIFLSKYFLDKVSEVETLDTIRHEIAHALEFIRHGTGGHGPVWKSIAREVGAKSERTCKAPIKHAYPYALMYEGKVIRSFFRVPKSVREGIQNITVKGIPESRGKVRLCKLHYN